MTDLMINTICTVLVLFVAAPLVMCIFQCPDRRLKKAYIITGLCKLLWLFCIIIYHTSNDAATIAYFANLTYPFIAFLPLCMFLTIALFYKQSKYAAGKTIILFAIIPFCTSLIALIPSLNWLLWVKREVVSTYPLSIMEQAWNWWYYIHLAYCYLMLTASIVLAVKHNQNQPGGYTVPLVMIVCSVLCVMTGSIITLTGSFDMDMTPITGSVGILVMYIAIAINPDMEYLALARKVLFYRMASIVFILDNRRYVVDKNDAAKKWLGVLNFTNDPPYEYEKILYCLLYNGGILKESRARAGDQNIYLKIDGEQMVYNMTEHRITDRKDRVVGSYIELTDITQYSTLITQLELDAELDILTGIYNRRAYERLCLEMDVESNLPLSVIIADVNGLKSVNDRMGHKGGDELLRVVAKTMMQVCHGGAIAARIGGDEFALVMPGCTIEEADAKMDEIRSLLGHEKNDSYTPTVALGAATKTSMDQDLQTLIGEADASMYQRKENDRRRNRG
jgi:diguanylate cyclase (GGDEF)-like protein